MKLDEERNGVAYDNMVRSQGRDDDVLAAAYGMLLLWVIFEYKPEFACADDEPSPHPVCDEMGSKQAGGHRCLVESRGGSDQSKPIRQF